MSREGLGHSFQIRETCGIRGICQVWIPVDRLPPFWPDLGIDDLDDRWSSTRRICFSLDYRKSVKSWLLHFGALCYLLQKPHCKFAILSSKPFDYHNPLPKQTLNVSPSPYFTCSSKFNIQAPFLLALIILYATPADNRIYDSCLIAPRIAIKRFENHKRSGA